MATVAWTILCPDLRLKWGDPEALYGDAATLEILIARNVLKRLDAHDVKLNMQQHAEGCNSGGEAEVQFVRWHGRGLDGQRVALKVYHRSDGHGGFKSVDSTSDVYLEAQHCQQSLRKEVNTLAILHHSGFADRVPPVLGVYQHFGCLEDTPLYGYAMPYYRYGSLAGFIRDVCDRRLPDSVFGGFFSPPRMTGEYSKLMATLLRLHTGVRGVMLQDISSNNLLIDEERGGCRLLLADPSMAFLISDLQQPDSPYLVSTWMWGTLSHRHQRFDPTADCYSLSFSFLEVWLCAEGAAVSLFELVQMAFPHSSRPEGHTFTRALCVAVLKRHASGTKSIVPRIRRELPVSWLQLWLLLLGTEDFASKEQLLSQQSHRRPSEPDMVEASAELAGVAADVEALGGNLTAASLATPTGEALVGRCLRLHERLMSLTQLEPPEGCPLLPLDPSLSWVATRFMSQDHPLVAAMRAKQGAEHANRSPALEPIPSKLLTFSHAVQDAQAAAGGDPAALFAAKQEAIAALEAEAAAAQEAIAAKQVAIDCQDAALSVMEQAVAGAKYYHRMLISMCQDYRRVRDVALALLPPGADRRQLDIGHLDPYLQDCINTISNPGDAEPSAAAAAPPAASSAQPASQQLHPAGPPPAQPLAAAYHSMPLRAPVSPAHDLFALHAASMPLLAILATRCGRDSTAGAGVQPPLEVAAAPAGLQGPQGPTAAGLPAQQAVPTAAAVSAGAAAGGNSLFGSLPGSSAGTAAGAASRLPMASFLPQPAALSPATAHPLVAAPSGAAAGAVPRSPAGPPPPSFLQPLPSLPAAAGISSADLSSHTVAADGPSDASPATSGGSGLSSPSKRKRGAEQGAPPSMLPPGTTLRFAVSRSGAVTGLPAFRLPPNTNGSNLYAYMVAQLSERLRGDVHQLLAQQQGPYAALLGASGLQPAQLDSLVAGSGGGDAYIEVSAASFLPGINAASHAAAAPIVFHSSSRGLGGSEQQIESGGSSAAEQARYSTALQVHLKQSLANDLPLAYGSGTTATVLFRIAAQQLPQGAAAMPWVPHEWEVPAADLAAIADKASHLFRKKK